jgi:hypothetical protein
MKECILKIRWYKTFDETGRKITGYKSGMCIMGGDSNPLFGHG